MSLTVIAFDAIQTEKVLHILMDLVATRETEFQYDVSFVAEHESP